MEKMGTLNKNGDQKTIFGHHGDQSPQMGTNLGAVQGWKMSEFSQMLAVRLGGVMQERFCEISLDSLESESGATIRTYKA